MMVAIGIGCLVMCSLLGSLLVPLFDGGLGGDSQLGGQSDMTTPAGPSEYEVALRAQIAAYPDDAASHLALANLLATRGQYADAASSYTTALRLDPENALAHRAFGLAMLDARQLAVAEAELQWLVTKDPKDAEAWYFLGEVYRLWLPQRTSDAERAYKQAMDVAPGTLSADEAATALSEMLKAGVPLASPVADGTPTAGETP